MHSSAASLPFPNHSSLLNTLVLPVRHLSPSPLPHPPTSHPMSCLLARHMALDTPYPPSHIQQAVQNSERTDFAHN